MQVAFTDGNRVFDTSGHDDVYSSGQHMVPKIAAIIERTKMLNIRWSFGDVCFSSIVFS